MSFSFAFIGVENILQPNISNILNYKLHVLLTRLQCHLIFFEYQYQDNIATTPFKLNNKIFTRFYTHTHTHRHHHHEINFTLLLHINSFS